MNKKIKCLNNDLVYIYCIEKWDKKNHIFYSIKSFINFDECLDYYNNLLIYDSEHNFYRIVKIISMEEVCI